jgi:hypothetical protein
MSLGEARWPGRSGTRFLVAAGFFVLLAVACQQADDDDEPFDPGTTAGSSGTAGAGASSSSSGGSAGADGGEGLAGAPRVGQGGGGAPGAAGEGGGSPLPAGGACGGALDDGACASCLQTRCCSEWQACELDDDCRACTACLDSDMDLGTCVIMNLCDIAPQATSEMLLCGLDPCVSECGFD